MVFLPKAAISSLAVQIAGVYRIGVVGGSRFVACPRQAVFYRSPSGPERGVSMTLEQRAKKVRNELFTRYDQLNALWSKAEAELTKVHIPKPVTFGYDHHPFDDFRPEQGGYTVCLGLQKTKGEWRICYGCCGDHEPEPDTWTPIVECSAEIRVQAAKHLPGLRKKAVESAEKFVPKVDEAIAALTAALDPNSNLEELLAERAKLNGQSN